MKKLVIIIVSLYFFSCSSSHKIHINSDNSATISFSIINKESLMQTLVEWGAIQNSDTLINTKQIQRDLEQDKNIENVKLSSTDNNNYLGSFYVTNINNLFTDSTKNIPKELQVFSLTDMDGIKTLKIQMSLENYAYLKQALPILQEESIDMLGPDANQEVSKEEYLDMMSFSLGDNGPQDILDSIIKLEISVDGLITEINGGIRLSENSALFEVSLIDIILLKKKLIYSLTYK